MMNLRERKKKYPNRVLRTIIDFGESTSFHGFKYTVCKDSSTFEKIFWILVIAVCFGGAIYMTRIFWERFNDNPIRITIQSIHKQTSIIPFPAVTICSLVRQVPKKVEKLLNKLELPNNVEKDDVRNALPSLLGYVRQIKLNESDLILLDSVFRKNNYTSVEDIFLEIEPSCSEMLLKCKWEDSRTPCSSIFTVSITRSGHCCSFNSELGHKKFRKYRTLFYGPQMGLAVIIDPFTENITKAVSTISSTGIKVLIHNPPDYAGITSIEKMIGNGSETYIRVIGTKLTSSENVRSLTTAQRNCLFKEEVKLDFFPYYTDNNCGTKCKMNRLLYYCNCIPFNFPQRELPICNITDISCLTRNYNDIFRFSSKKHHEKTVNSSDEELLNCNCPSQCDDVFYGVQTSNLPLNDKVYTTSDFYKLNKGNNITNKIIIHVYFGSHYQTEMLRDTITSTYYLLASFGGVFSLFLGCSFLSILEIIYFFCIRIFTK